LFVLIWLLRVAVGADARDLTFYVVSDTHYGTSTNGDQMLSLLVNKMNTLHGAAYPDAIGGVVAKPRGVLHIGDITNKARKPEWESFLRDYARLAWPVYETFGNHDGGATSPVRIGIRERNKKRVGLTTLSENGLHYSWDWDGIHFVNCGICPGTTAKRYDPEHSLSWWPETWRIEYLAQIKPYNLIGILHGHAHKTSIYKWQGIDIYHTTHFRGDPKKNETPTHGFFVFHITDSELTVAERRVEDSWGMTSRKSLKRQHEEIIVCPSRVVRRSPDRAQAPTEGLPSFPRREDLAVNGSGAVRRPAPNPLGSFGFVAVMGIRCPWSRRDVHLDLR
jgi:predicted phosphodiesterase